MDAKNLLLAAAFSGLALGGAVSASEAAKDAKAAAPQAKSEEAGQCHGINECKGKSACHTATNSCGGQNSCKGKGWMKMTEKECASKKGTFKKS